MFMQCNVYVDFSCKKLYQPLIVTRWYYGESFKLGVQGIASFADMLLRP